MKKTVTVNRDALQLAVTAMNAAVTHLEACEAGKIIRPFKSRSLPLLRDALGKIEGRKKASMKYSDADYEKVLIAPIHAATTMRQVRARARWSRKKLDRHEKATRMSVGDAARVLDRITCAEISAASRVIKKTQHER